MDITILMSMSTTLCGYVTWLPDPESINVNRHWPINLLKITPRRGSHAEAKTIFSRGCPTLDPRSLIQARCPIR
ncbi:hypothetical protein V2G26_009164 [Clonostachys chloroleuca]